MYAVALYTLAPGRAERIPEVYPRHKAYLTAFQAETGDILLIGPFAERGGDAPGSMAVFRSREAAERFSLGDPFVVEGVVGDVRVLDWQALDFTGPASED
jgi:uncharacterized protein